MRTMFAHQIFVKSGAKVGIKKAPLKRSAKTLRILLKLCESCEFSAFSLRIFYLILRLFWRASFAEIACREFELGLVFVKNLSSFCIRCILINIDTAYVLQAV